VNAAAPATAIHRLVERCREDRYPPLVARMDCGWLVLGERQVFAGYCLLLPDPVVPHLNALRAAGREQFLRDMALAGDAILAAAAALRINYALFGNLEPALHAHIFPRRADEPAATRNAQPWAFDWTLAAEYSPAVHGDLQRRIAAALLQPSVTGEAPT
jgi:diadenosine tetraphosphate (Ap4A) HIT family hydrolase